LPQAASGTTEPVATVATGLVFVEVARYPAAAASIFRLTPGSREREQRVKLALIGYGALGRNIEAMITEAEPSGQIVYFDDQAAGAQPFHTHDSEEFADFRFFVCLGYKHLNLRKQILDRLVALGRSVPHFMHPSSYVHPSVTIGHGSVIYPGCCIDRNTTIGRGVSLLNGTVIAHDGSVGDACWFGPGVTLSGHVTIGERTFVGSGSAVANDVEIGSGVIIGLATAVTKHLGDNVSAIGNPVRILARPLKLV